MTPSIWLMAIMVLIISMIVSGTLRSKFNAYSRIALSSGLTGKEVAEKMLRDNGIYDVKVISVNGYLSDHYNPLTKTVNLSAEVYNGQSVASTAVAAHECGHALQHADAYSWLMFRSRLVPVVQYSSGIVQWILLAGILLIRAFPQVLLGGIILFALTTLFSLVTLPVEFDASNRALAWMNRGSVVTPLEYPKAKDALKWAALTYVIAAIASIVTLVQYVLFFFSGTRNRN